MTPADRRRALALSELEDRYGPDAGALALAAERLGREDPPPDPATVIPGEVLGEDDGDG